jgi:hypothetical protein
MHCCCRAAACGDWARRLSLGGSDAAVVSRTLVAAVCCRHGPLQPVLERRGIERTKTRASVIFLRCIVWVGGDHGVTDHDTERRGGIAGRLERRAPLISRLHTPAYTPRCSYNQLIGKREALLTKNGGRPLCTAAGWRCTRLGFHSSHVSHRSYEAADTIHASGAGFDVAVARSPPIF